MVSNACFCANDIYNRKKLRNQYNTDDEDYNCGGYALGIFNWYVPRSGRRGQVDYRNCTLSSCIQVMLNELPNVRQITDVRQLHKNEYAVAFRLGRFDFHYMRRAHNGHWTHKMGAWPIETILKSDVFSPQWCDAYDGEIALLAVRED